MGGESRGAGRGAAGGIGETSREVEAAGGGKATHVEDERGKQPAVEGRGAASAVGDEELPGGESRPSFFSPPYPFSSISRRQIQLRARRAAPSASAREIERARAAGPNFSRESAPLPPRRRLARLRAASAPPNRRLAPPSSASRPDCRLPP